MQQKKKVIIAGGGTAGWMTAAALAKLLGKNLDITLVESEEIGTEGVGEATIPSLHIYHELLGLKESDVMAATNATFKLGISFESWRNLNDNYIHSFGFLGKDCWAAQFHHFWVKGQQKGFTHPIGDYCLEHLAAREGRFGIYPHQERNHAYHLDATLYAQFLRDFAEKFGAKRIEGKIAQVVLRDDDGYIESLRLESGLSLAGDLFVDCTGFSGLLIEQALHTGYDDWSHWLPCDRAVAVQTASSGTLVPFTRSIAHQAGWQWQIPLQTRTDNGMVYCSRYWSDDEALGTLTANLDGEALTSPRVIPFRTGTRRLHWNKNCVAIGLSSGFIEPLESTGIHLIQRSLVKLMLLFPADRIHQADVDEFNRQTREELEHIRDFIVLHYNITDRRDSPFWRHCAGMKIPESLKHRLALFRETGRIHKYDTDLFGESSWVQVMMGQGITPRTYHPIVDLMGDQELNQFLENIRLKVKQHVAQLPPHAKFIKRYCSSNGLGEQQAQPETNFATLLKPVLDVKVALVGRGNTPVLSADDVCAGRVSDIRASAQASRFDKDATSLYPGVRTDLPRTYVEQVIKRIAEPLYEVYKVPKNLKPTIKQACFSLVTQPPGSLGSLQRIPHFDSTSPYFFAILHYLGEGQHGDTGFYRHTPTGLERILEDDKKAYFASASQHMQGLNEQAPAYIGESDNQYNLFYRMPYATDRLVIYPGNVLHSVIVNPTTDISWDIHQGRLTANIFLAFE